MDKEWIWDLLAKKNPIYAAVSAHTEDQERAKTMPQIETILGFIGDGIVLDAGCGYGRIAKYLLPIRNFASYIGIDMSQVMLQEFHRMSKEFRWSTPVFLIKSPLENIPLKNGTIDNIITIAVLLHCPRASVYNIINEFHRILKPGGRLIALASFPNVCTFSGIQGLCYETFLAVSGKASANGPVRYWSKYKVINLFRDFSCVQILPSGFNLIPKSILGLPMPINQVWRKAIYERLSPFVYKLLPLNLRNLFCTHYDVVAIK